MSPSEDLRAKDFTMDESDATALAAAIRDGQLSSAELTDHYLSRIEERNDELRAFVSFSRGKAMAQARKKDRQVQSGASHLPPFHGVPIGIKDLNMVRGMWTRWGSRGGIPVYALWDDKDVKSLKAAGFVILGKLATSEIGAMPVTEPDNHPPTRNPHDPRLTSGGSSGGSGTAVAAGFLPIAHGSDAGGSIRIPSACCGLYGLKPSQGLLPNAYGFPTEDLLYSSGPLARSVRDLRSMTAAMALDPTRLEPGVPEGGLRIAYSLSNLMTRPEDAVRESMLALVEELRAAGHQVEERPFFEGELEEFMPMYTRMMADVPMLREKRLQKESRWLRAQGRKVKKAEMLVQLQALRERVAAWFGDVQIWLTPTIPFSPPKVGFYDDPDPERNFTHAAQIGSFTAPFNVSGQPAANMPLGRFSSGMPMGIQWVGRKGEDGTLLSLMERFGPELAPLPSRRG